MKKYLLALAIIALLLSKNDAQRLIPVFRGEINGPLASNGYQKGAYYFLPDVDVYYYMPSREFFYLNNGEWFSSRSLPAKYHGFDLYNCYKIRIKAEKPYLDNEYYQTKYAGYRGEQYNKYNSETVAENYRVEDRGQQSSRERYKDWHNNFRKNNSANDQYTVREEQTTTPSQITPAPEKYKDNYQPKQESKKIQKQTDDFDPYAETTPRENNSYIPPPVVPEQKKPDAVKAPVTNIPVSDKPGTIKPQALPAKINPPAQDSSAAAKPMPDGQRSAYGSWDKKKTVDQ